MHSAVRYLAVGIGAAASLIPAAAPQAATLPHHRVVTVSEVLRDLLTRRVLGADRQGCMAYDPPSPGAPATATP